MPFNPFSALTSKLFGAGLVLSLITLGPALLITRATLADAREDIAALTDWQDKIVAAVRLASNNPKADAGTAAEQIGELGFIRVQLKAAVETQNAAIDAMSRESEAALLVAERARQERAAAVRRAEALQSELRSRALVPAPAADMEAAVRQSQDELYEAGL
jgi:ribonucleotide monophosphatase NagD (HAD superfamily)